MGLMLERHAWLVSRRVGALGQVLARRLQALARRAARDGGVPRELLRRDDLVHELVRRLADQLTELDDVLSAEAVSAPKAAVAAGWTD